MISTLLIKVPGNVAMSSVESNFNASSTTDDVLEGIDLSAKVVLVTGASSGLGIETARSLAVAGATVIMAARDQQRLDKAQAQILAQHPDVELASVIVDLADLASVRSAAQSLLAAYSQINLIINNAGIMACAFGKTSEGCELQFGTNHIGHFLLTNLLQPSLIAGAPARVINLSSMGHMASPVLFDDLSFEKQAYDKWIAYGQAKTANVLFSVALNNRLSAHGVTSFSVHPGVIVTELGRHMDKEDYQTLMASMGDRELIYKSIPQGAATSVWAATSPALAGLGGLYLEDCHVAELATEDSPAEGYRAYALDPEEAKRLWAVSEQIVGECFDEE